MNLLTKEQILTANDLKFEEVDVPEWGGVVRVRMMSGSARDQYEMGIINGRTKNKGENLANIRASLLAYTIIDNNGDLLFTKDDIEALGKKSIGPIVRVFDVASSLNSLREKDVEKLAGN